MENDTCKSSGQTVCAGEPKFNRGDVMRVIDRNHHLYNKKVTLDAYIVGSTWLVKDGFCNLKEIPESSLEPYDNSETVVTVDKSELISLSEKLTDIISNLKYSHADRTNLVSFQDDFIRLFGEDVFVNHYEKEISDDTETKTFKVGDKVIIARDYDKRFLNRHGVITYLDYYDKTTVRIGEWSLYVDNASKCLEHC